MRSVLSYWRSYFDPGGEAEFANCSTGLIAARLDELLRAWVSVDYYDAEERPRGLDADLFVGHFWAFVPVCQANSFATKVAVYVLTDPDRARRLLARQAARHNVPMPDWDLPPADFDHAATMELADQVLLVGNQHTLATFPQRGHPKIRLVNYAVDEQLWARPMRVNRRPSFVYLAKHCVVIEPRNPAQHREAIRWVLTWPQAECDTRSRRLRQAAQAHHTWTVFTEQVNAAVAPLLGGGIANPVRRT